MSKNKSKFDPSAPVTRTSDTRRLPPGACINPEIEEMFDLVLAAVDDDSDFGRVLNSLYNWWETKQFLTRKQYDLLTATYEKHGGR